MANAKNVEGLLNDQKCERCSYSRKPERGIYFCTKKESGRKVEISSSGRCLNHWRHTDAEYEKGTWH